MVPAVAFWWKLKRFQYDPLRSLRSSQIEPDRSLMALNGDLTSAAVLVGLVHRR